MLRWGHTCYSIQMFFFQCKTVSECYINKKIEFKSRTQFQWGMKSWLHFFYPSFSRPVYAATLALETIFTERPLLTAQKLQHLTEKERQPLPLTSAGAQASGATPTTSLLPLRFGHGGPSGQSMPLRGRLTRKSWLLRAPSTGAEKRCL